MESIIISGMPAVGKTTVGKLVARELGFSLVGGGDVLKEIAIERGYKPGGDDWWDKEEGMRFLQERKKNPDFDKEVDLRLVEKAKKGNCVITSYTLPWLSSSGVKVWLMASLSTRARRMARRDGIPYSECKKVLSVRDSENTILYKRIYSINFGSDLKPFDLVVDTDYINEKRVSSIIVEFYRARVSKND